MSVSVPPLISRYAARHGVADAVRADGRAILVIDDKYRVRFAPARNGWVALSARLYALPPAGAARENFLAGLGRQGFDLVVALSPEARDRAPGGGAVEYWPLPDPTQCEGSREQRLAAYRAVRDALSARLEARFAAPATPET